MTLNREPWNRGFQQLRVAEMLSVYRALIREGIQSIQDERIGELERKHLLKWGCTTRGDLRTQLEMLSGELGSPLKLEE
jgi:hypothetical protein